MLRGAKPKRAQRCVCASMPHRSCPSCPLPERHRRLFAYGARRQHIVPRRSIDGAFGATSRHMTDRATHALVSPSPRLSLGGRAPPGLLCSAADLLRSLPSRVRSRLLAGALRLHRAAPALERSRPCCRAGRAGVALPPPTCSTASSTRRSGGATVAAVRGAAFAGPPHPGRAAQALFLALVVIRTLTASCARSAARRQGDVPVRPGACASHHPCRPGSGADLSSEDAPGAPGRRLTTSGPTAVRRRRPALRLRVRERASRFAPRRPQAELRAREREELNGLTGHDAGEEHAVFAPPSRTAADGDDVWARLTAVATMGTRRPRRRGRRASARRSSP